MIIEPDASREENLSPASPGGELAQRWNSLRRFAGAPRQFWAVFLAETATLCKAQEAVVLRCGNGGAARESSWQVAGRWNDGGGSKLAARVLADAARRTVDEGRSILPLDENAGAREGVLLGIRLVLAGNQESCVALYRIGAASDGVHALVLPLELVADTPDIYLRERRIGELSRDLERIGAVMELMVQVNMEKRFLAAAMAFCNGLAALLECDRLSLGWKHHHLIRLQVISRTEKFERRMEAAQCLERAMEEALEQEQEILWPPPEGQDAITRDHEEFATTQKIAALCSVPLRLNDEVVGIFTCERDRPFTEDEVRLLALHATQAVRCLSDLKRNDRWWGARLWLGFREGIGRRLGPEHTGRKLAAVLASAALVTVLVMRPEYRPDADFILKSDQTGFLTAPFDGFIATVEVREGDTVEQGQLLASLGREELELEEAAALADLARYLRDMEKARASGALAEMRMNRLMADQAQARLDLVRFRLERARLHAPFDGVVVEGEPRERIGAPVRQGDVLLKVARTDTLFVEALVSERDIQEIAEDTTGEIAFASQPRLKFPVVVERIHAAAEAKEGENLFRIRCRFDGPPASWWRPGMTGICKINAGRRSLVWIFTHRTVDFLRMWMWW